MAIKIDSNIVIGNALIYLKQSILSKELIYQYWNNVDNMLPENYYTYGNNTSFEDFCDRYSFLVKRYGNKIIIDDSVYSSGILNRYFSFAISSELSSIFKIAALNFYELEKNEDNSYKKIKKVEK